MSGRQPLQLRHAVHGAVQQHQEAQAVEPQVGLFRIDHHPVEEGVDRLAQRGQGPQRSGVVAFVDFLLEREEKAALKLAV